MAPLRSSRTRAGLNTDYASTNTRRGAGGVIDHDPTEGLPVRKWDYKDVTVNQNPKQAEENSTGGFMFPNENYPWSELPLPKDYDGLPPHNQQLLRRARAGNTFMKKNDGNFKVNGSANPPNNPTEAAKPSSPAPEDAENAPANNHKNFLDEDRAFTVRRWTPAVRQDLSERTFLAPRRPGLPPLYGHSAFGNTNFASAPAVEVKKKTVKVKKTDADTGNTKIYDVMIIEGMEHTIDGEIIPEDTVAPSVAAPSTDTPTEVAKPTSGSDTNDLVSQEQITTESLAPGTVVEGVGVANEEGVVVAPAAAAALSTLNTTAPQPEVNRRKPPPPKRKKFGPGRGKKGPMKKVVFEGEGGQIEAVGVVRTGEGINGTANGGAQPSEAVDKNGDTSAKNGQIEGENDNDNDGDEEDDEGEGSEEGEIEEGPDEDRPIALERAKEAIKDDPVDGLPQDKASYLTPAEAISPPEAASASKLDQPEVGPPVEASPKPVKPENTAISIEKAPTTIESAALSSSDEPLSKLHGPTAEASDTVMAEAPSDDPSPVDLEIQNDTDQMATTTKAKQTDVSKDGKQERPRRDSGVGDEMDLLGRLEEGIDEAEGA
ncbi:MAG: hypothetical protein Q9227_003768 [Pyrenula ochraceoflavens]